MKQLIPTFFALGLVLCSGHAAAVNIVNTTGHTIETRLIEDEDLDGFAVTIDGKPTLFGELFLILNQTGESTEAILEIANQTPIFPTTSTQISFSLSELCVGSASGDVIQAILTYKGESEILCFEKHDQFYAAFPFGGF